MQIAPISSMRRDAGMTLVETIVCLAIIAAMAGATVVSVGAADRAVDPETEARRLAARINLASDWALIESEPANLAWDERGYAFSSSRTDETHAPPFAGRHDLGGDLTLTGPTPTGSVAISDVSGTDEVTFVVISAQGAWAVAFNGLAAVASGPVS